MKHIYLAFLLFGPFCIYAQSYTYKALDLDTSCFWIHSYYHYYPSQECSGEKTTIVEKDTLINSTSYYKLRTYTTQIGIVSGSICSNALIPFDVITFLREDTSAKKIYKWMGGSAEVPLLDFAKNIGDTLDIGLYSYNPIVDSIAIQTFNGIDRKMQFGVFGLGNLYATIEGIGATYSFPVSGYGEWHSPDFTLLCYSKGGVTLYPDSSTPCLKGPKVFVGLNDIPSLKINYTFNKNTFSIQDIGNKQVELFVYSIQGALLFEEKYIHSWYKKEFTSTFSPGVYVFSLRSGNSRLNFKAIIE